MLAIVEVLDPYWGPIEI